MTASTASTASYWLTEFDDIDASWNTTAFNHSRLGRLPIELLEPIVQYIPKSHLPAVARISSQLRELAEKCLYSHIDIGDRHGCTTSKDPFWPLLCTLVRRSDLAQMVRDFSGTVYDQDVNVEVDTSNIFPGDTHFRSATKVLLNQMVIAGRILLELLTKVNKVHLTLNLPYKAVNSWVDTTTCKLLALEPLSTCRLIPDFDSLTANRLYLPGLQQLTEFDYAGSEFHWALAKLPCLRKLRLTRPCVVLPDEASNEVNRKVTTLEISARSEILRGDSRHYVTLKAFLAHFPSLVNLRVVIYDIDVDALPEDVSDPQDQNERSYSILLERLSSVADHLKALHLGVNDDADDYDGHASKFLCDVQPASSFRQFKSLKTLIVPYRCLLGRTTSTVDTLPSSATILPATLKDLRIHCPQIHIYDWLMRFRKVRNRLPALSEIELYCQLPYGDEYPVFAFENWDHPAMDMMTEELGITVHVTSRERDWNPDWNDYDLDILDVIDWLDSLGEHNWTDGHLEGTD